MDGRPFRTGSGPSRLGMLRDSYFEEILLVLRAKIDYESKVGTALRRSLEKLKPFAGSKCSPRVLHLQNRRNNGLSAK